MVRLRRSAGARSGFGGERGRALPSRPALPTRRNDLPPPALALSRSALEVRLHVANVGRDLMPILVGPTVRECRELRACVLEFQLA